MSQEVSSTGRLKKAVEYKHGGDASYVQSVPVKKVFEGRTVWEGVVSVFELANHPIATRAYAWAYRLQNGKRRFVAVLHYGPVKGPRDAVSAAIVMQQNVTF